MTPSSVLGWQSWSPAYGKLSWYQWDRCPLPQGEEPNRKINSSKKKLGIYLDTWALYGPDITEQKIINIATQHPQVDTIMIDDGYQQMWGDGIDMNKFPRGIKPLVDDLRKMGYKTGIWYCPFLVDPHSELSQQHPDWIVTDLRGNKMNGYRSIPYLSALLQNKYILNTHIPAVQQHIYAEIDKRIGWGVTCIKLDFLYAPFFDPHVTDTSLPNETLIDLFDYIRCHHPGIYTHACGCPFEPARGRVDTIRISKDTNSPYLDKYIAPVGRIMSLYRKKQLHNKLEHLTRADCYNLSFDPDAAMTEKDFRQLQKYYDKGIINTIGKGYIG